MASSTVPAAATSRANATLATAGEHEDHHDPQEHRLDAEHVGQLPGAE
ncbi:hypothetical protein I6J71_36735 [Amycolatopsis sp. FDAARGOS 1241]|nr:hypothetical protein [Amycolatopsis sp. FDAARGOS 1241]QRP44736.1 hypothetical protein I6J71_36735 [Amycolatopsis sp. FDAARGOS 1241]